MNLYSVAAVAALAVAMPANVYAQVAKPAAGNPTYSAEVEARIAQVAGDIVPFILPDGPGRTKTSLDERMKALAVPGVSIAVINDGKLEWARGFGVAKVGGPAMTPETMFAAASVSKPISAFGALKLVQDGKIDLDTDVNKYLKSWKLPENEFTKDEKVTLRRLLTHTGGTTVHGFPGYVPGTPYPTLKQILDGEKPANTGPIRVDTKPGTIWRYSGGGYTIAQQMVIDVSGNPFADYQRETVFAKLGMKNSSFEQPLPADKLAHTATPYGNNLQPIAGGARVDPSLMAAGLWTTPSDLALYVMEVQQAAAGKSSKVLSPAMVAQMIKGDGLGNWGLGVATGGDGAGKWFGHGGDDPGFHNEFVGHLNGDGAIVMTNSDGGAQLVGEILRTIAYVYDWPSHKPVVRKSGVASAAAMDALAGTYRSGRYTTVRLWRDGEKMLGQASTSQTSSQVHRAEDGSWFYADLDVQYVTKADASGRVQSITVKRSNGESVYTRLEPAAAEALKTELATRIRDKTPDPQSEPALRRNIEELRRGEPDYTRMSPGLADVTKRQLTSLQTTIKGYGAIKSVVHRAVGPAGADIYFVRFENGISEWRILVGSDGIVESIGLGSPTTPAGDVERMAEWKVQDADGDNKLDKAAYGRLLTNLGFAGELDRLFAQRDTDKDGFISRQEFAPAAQ
ncbi:MAG TPA: serine hydrolase [Hyphomonadaceae bacterium]|jgi:CubicO group peptidase (beta-lactamase class C family)|nr:serine hydrolase [Hyphomonadaceae bacterium]